MVRFIFIFLVLITLFSFGQSIENYSPINRPKIGLVLSGGGAKGFAHVGVLKVIEQAGLKIDYIGGTSMGAAVGALYATGYAAKQVDSIITSINFMDMLTDKIDRKYASFFDKKHNEKYLLTLPIKNRKVGLPIAFSKGQNTYNKLTELFHPVCEISDFSKLPIPFFCLATDIETGNEVEINKGSLPLAIRSSASLPTLLSPSKMGDLTLIDGGVANNFPVENMKKKGVDIVIAVDVQGVLKKQDNIDSALKVVGQIVNFQLYGKEYVTKENIDVYIHPDVDDYGLVDFDKKIEIIKSGEVAANKFKFIFKELASKQAEAHQQKIDTKVQNYKLKNIKINGAKNYTRRYIKGKLNLKKGNKISVSSLGNRINYLAMTNNFNDIHYSFLKKDSLVELKFNITENTESTYLKLGVHYDNLYKLSGLVNLTKKHLFLHNDISSLDIALGDNIRYEFNYFIDNGHFLSYGLYARFNKFNTSVQTNNTNRNRINLEFRDFTNYLYTQINYRDRLAISLGIEHKYITKYTNTFSSSPETDRTYFDKTNYLNLLSKFELDTYDKKVFPNNGYLIKATFRNYLTSNDFNNNFEPASQIRVLLEGVKTISDRFSGLLQLDGGLTATLKSQPNIYFELGGYGNNFVNNYVPFHGYSFGQLVGGSYLKSLASIRYRFYKKNYIDVLANYAVVTDDVLEFLKHDSFFTNAKTGYSVGYGVNTFLGPFEIRYAFSPENKKNTIYFSAGLWF